MKKRNAFKMMFQLLGLIQSLLVYMVFAVIFGVLGHISAIFIPVLGVSLITFSEYRKSIMIVLVVAALLRGVFRYIEQALNHELAFRVLAQLRDKIFEKMRQLAPAKLDTSDRGNLISLITGDIEHLEVFFAHTISPVFIALIVNSLVVIAVFKISNTIGLITLISYLLIGVVFPIFFSAKARVLGKYYRDTLGNINSFILERVIGVFDVIQYNHQTNSIKELDEKTSKLNQSQKRMNLYTISNSISVEVVIFISNLLIIIIAVKNNMDPKIWMFALTLHTSSFGPVIALSNLANNMYHTLSSGDRVLNLLEEKPEVNDITEHKDLNTINAFNIKHVDFSYNDKKVLDNVSMSSKGHEIIGIQGESGSGKSTLLKLMMRYYQTSKGSIEFDSCDVNDINSKSLKSNQAYMSQATDLFKMSIMDNIRLGNYSATDEEVIKAAKDAGIHDYILKLSQQYETNVSEFGSSLSSGEKQRIALARLFLKDAPLLILDEPTSNLDSLNEAIILDNLEKHAQNKTIIITSHRNSTMNITDRRYTADILNSSK